MVSGVIDNLLYHFYHTTFEKLSFFIVIQLMIYLFFSSQSKKQGKIILKN